MCLIFNAKVAYMHRAKSQKKNKDFGVRGNEDIHSNVKGLLPQIWLGRKKSNSAEEVMYRSMKSSLFANHIKNMNFQALFLKIGHRGTASTCAVFKKKVARNMNNVALLIGRNEKNTPANGS